MSVAIAIFGGTLLGLLVSYFAIKRLAASRWMLSSSQSPTTGGRRTVWVVAIIAIPFAWLLGFVVGGNFGGALAGRFAESSGLSEAILIPSGIGLGIALCTAMLSIGSALLGLLVVRLFERLGASPPRM
jgi:hypothetical protein